MPTKNTKQQEAMTEEEVLSAPGPEMPEDNKPVLEITVFDEVTAEKWAESDVLFLTPELVEDKMEEVLTRLFEVGVIKATRFLEDVAKNDLPEETKLHFRFLALGMGEKGIGGDSSISLEDLYEYGPVMGGAALTKLVDSVMNWCGLMVESKSFVLGQLTIYPAGKVPQDINKTLEMHLK